MNPQSTDTASIIGSLLEIAPELERVLGEEWPEVRDLLARMAAQVDDENALDSLRLELDNLLARLLDGPLGAEVRRVLAQTAGHRLLVDRGSVLVMGPAHGQNLAPTPGSPARLDADGVVFVPVFYGTSRAWRGGDDPAECYTADRAELAFGVVHVSVPTNHEVGELEGPRWWKFERKENPTKHFALLRVKRLDETEFVGRARETVAALECPEALLFIHGYNVPFSSAAKRAAQLAVDLKFDGPVLLYSWPSLGDPRLYMADEATIEFCRPHFEQFIRIALTQMSAGSLHAIAHSMGNRPLASALERLNPAELPAGSAVLRQVVFAAPDVDCDVFRQSAGAFRGRAQRCTLYASSNDLALKLSKALHHYPRAGDAGPSLVIADGVDTVDASEVDTSIFGLGHSYFAQKRSILSDVYNLLRHGSAPDGRFDLTASETAQGRYWKYKR
jgi:esterase/lipase superfamily enzyme